MGQSLMKIPPPPPLGVIEEEEEDNVRDLNELPPEIVVNVLGNLNATDLSLAGCVWQEYASDEILWYGLCRQEWSYTSIYEKRNPSILSAKKLYLLLDEGTLTFNSDFQKGMDYFFAHGLLKDNTEDIAQFFNGSHLLSKSEMKKYLQKCTDVTDRLVYLQNFSSQSLPNALRKFFSKLEAPDDRGRYLQQLLNTFSRRFCQCNPKLGYSVDFVYVSCYSLILLSVDLSSPHVKNKMSKREFIRNTRNAVGNDRPLSTGDEIFGEMYDNVFLRGHVSCGSQQIHHNKMQFVPGYLAIFL
ncbi:FBXO8 [Lepeophtheirus salmonis]|uniref:FBXO8 n=1 Tax=Lepeophtheirus salmonis TaxID=72036 RepID=A0A0K2TD60_LEPSM|nr:F-box only protein 8-like [Lepeophtheirus salmonis]CAB4062256.1 FBXO8 [Lepeophtheirus salmonis]CAF2899549.1 FBXO8 [Lepeophtheirus salmonis]